jgi:hypothetical protein
MIFAGIGIIDSAASAAVPPVEQLFTSSGTWSCCPGATYLEVVTIGGGAAGQFVTACCAPGTNYNQRGGPGGGAGGVVVCTLTSGFGSSQCVVVGSGGTSCAGASCNCSSPGGASCFGSLVIANGGAVGAASTLVFDFTTVSTISGGVGGNGSSNGGNAKGGGCFPSENVVIYTSCNAGNSGQTIAGKPGGGGGGGSTVRRGAGSGLLWLTRGVGGAGGSASSICGIPLGAGGAGNESSINFSGARPGFNATCYGGGGGGGGALDNNLNITASSCGGSGFQGAVKVIQYFSAPPVVPMSIQFNTSYYYTPTEAGLAPLSTDYYYNPNLN